MKNICRSARGLNKKMSKKATAVLITALIAVIAATCVGVAYVMVNEGSDLTLNGAEMTINGDGCIDPEAGENNSYGIDIVSGGSLTINGGTYDGSDTPVYSGKGTVTINTATL